jgi:exopolysaccharide biosynthesis glucuronosyltransferase PssD
MAERGAAKQPDGDGRGPEWEQRAGMTRVLAIASGGGHWVQLCRLRPLLDDYDAHYVSVDRSYAGDVPGRPLYRVRDASRWNKLGLVVQALQILWIVLRVRPRVVLSTGAAPGFFGLLFGKLIGARTIWIDSLANVEELSLSGRQARRYADLWLTQWPHLARPEGPRYLGAVL